MTFSPVHTWRLNNSLLSKSPLHRNAQQLLCSRRRTLTYGDTLTIHQAKLRISSVLLPYWSGRDTTLLQNVRKMDHEDIKRKTKEKNQKKLDEVRKTKTKETDQTGQFCARLCTFDCLKSGLVGGLDRITCAHSFHVTLNFLGSPSEFLIKKP